mgnify:CR=1 FL=1
MVIKYGPHGKFLACPGFPECRNTKPYLEKSELPARNVEKTLYCARQRKADVIMDVRIIRNVIYVMAEASEEKCPKCGSYMVEKGNKLVCGNEQCGFVKNKEKDEK